MAPTKAERRAFSPFSSVTSSAKIWVGFWYDWRSISTISSYAYMWPGDYTIVGSRAQTADSVYMCMCAAAVPLVVVPGDASFF